MKDVVDFESRREIETVVEVTDMLDDLVGAELTRIKLATRLVDSDVLGREPDLGPNLEHVWCFSVSFILCLHLIMREAECDLNVLLNFLQYVKVFVHTGNPGQGFLYGNIERWLVPV